MNVLTLLFALEDGPAPEDVKAGWVALILFVLMALSVAFLGVSLTKRLRNAESAKDAGLYGDPPVESASGPDVGPELSDESPAPDSPTPSA